MQQNPLDKNEHFYLTLANPNPSSSKTKDGPKYRVSFELSQDEWQMFMDAETAGMVMECACQITHRNGEKVPETPEPGKVIEIGGEDAEDIIAKGGPLSQRSDILARDPEFQRYLVDHLHIVPREEQSPADMAREWIRGTCGVKSRALLDYDDLAATRFQNDCLKPFIRYSS